MIEKRNIQDEYLEKFKNEGKELTVNEWFPITRYNC